MNTLVKRASRTFFGSSIVGAGLFFGRDAYKVTKNYGGLLLLILGVLFVFYLPYRAGRNLFCGHDRGRWGTIFQTVLWSAFLFSVSYLMLMMLFGSMDSKQKTFGEFAVHVAGLNFILLTPFFGLGALVGLVQRPKRKRMFEAEGANEQFLRSKGIIETGDHNAPYQDSQGNRLRLVDTQKSQLTFMVVGRRNRRAYIDLDGDGKMVRYSGVMKI